MTVGLIEQRSRGRDTGVVAGLALTAALAWLWLGPRTPDLAAQVYRADLFAAHGFVIYDPGWYGGHDVPAYSLLFPPLGALLGVRVVGVLAAIGGALCFHRLVADRFPPGARWATRWFAVAVVSDLLIGRVTYALGVALALAAVLAWESGRPRLGVAGGILAAVASPIAGAFLALAAVALALSRRRVRPLLLGLGPLVAVIVLQAAFPEGGRQPFSVLSLIPVVVFGVAGCAALPSRMGPARVALGLYVIVAVAAFATSSPLGSNVDRLGSGLFVPVLLLGAAGTEGRAPRRVLIALALAAMPLAWWSPVAEVAKGLDDPSSSAAYYEPLLGYLRSRAPLDGRVEVPFTRTHWESEVLAPHVPLARGWERQLDTRYGALFYRRRLEPDAYVRWLRHQAVRYVAVPDAPLDYAGRAEARLIARRPPFLRPVWRSAHWQVYEVVAARPLLTGPARLLAVGPDRVVLRVRRPGRMLLRLRWTSLWHVEGAGACAGRSPDGFTQITASRSGPVTLTARLSVAGLLRTARACGA